jgi:hypothetical protein
LGINNTDRKIKKNWNILVGWKKGRDDFAAERRKKKTTKL